MVCGIYGIVHLWSYVNQTLVCNDMHENRNCPINFDDGLLCRFSAISVWRFMGCVETPFMTSCKPGFIMDQFCWISKILDISWRKPPVSNFDKICYSVYGMQGEIVCGVVWSTFMAENQIFQTISRSSVGATFMPCCKLDFILDQCVFMCSVAPASIFLPAHWGGGWCASIMPRTAGSVH